jgi:hypothetical protein
MGLNGFQVWYWHYELLRPNHYVNVNNNITTLLVARTGRAVNVATGDVGLFSVTEGPSFCVHKYVSIPPRGSVLAYPSSVTIVS